MSRKNRSNIALGVILILVGAYFLGQRFFPEFILFRSFEWPMIIMGVGVLLLLIGLLSGQPGMAVPAAILAGIGGLLYYQNANNNWESWSYAWTLIPGFVGIGSVLAGLLGDNPRQSIRHGLNLILLSGVLFAIFFAIFTENQWAAFWPVILIAFGLWLLARAILRR